MLVGLHTHTHPNSWDSFLTPDEAVDRAKEVGLDLVVMTEHDWAWDEQQWRDLQKRHEDIVVLRAMELNTEDGHVVCFGLHEYIFGMHRAWELAGHVYKRGGCMIVAHPYRRQMPWRWDKEEDNLAALLKAESNPLYRFGVGIEVANGRGVLKENTFSLTVMQNMGMPGTGADDAHELKDLGKTATYFDADIRTEEDLIAALKSGRFWPIDRTGGTKLADPLYHDVPSDIEHIWQQQAETRRRRHAEGMPEFQGRPEDHPHLQALTHS